MDSLFTPRGECAPLAIGIRVIVFDTDALSQILRGTAEFVKRVAAIPADEQAITAVTAEELLRGRLDIIREAQGRRDGKAIVSAYHWFVETIESLSRVHILRDSVAAETQFSDWQSAKLKGGANDLRIASIVKAANATLVTCNRRHFDQLPGLRVESWS